MTKNSAAKKAARRRAIAERVAYAAARRRENAANAATEGRSSHVGRTRLAASHPSSSGSVFLRTSTATEPDATCLKGSLMTTSNARR